MGFLLVGLPPRIITPYPRKTPKSPKKQVIIAKKVVWTMGSTLIRARMKK
jgi:hypothetical protein